MGTNSPIRSIIQQALHVLQQCLCNFVRFVMIKAYGEHGESIPPIDDRLLLESATSIAEKIRTKQATAVQVMTAFIRRIEQVNPLLNCVVDERFRDALAEAAEVDELIASNKYTADELRETKPFLGVPISIKDNIAVKGMIQTCGLWLRRNKRAREDAKVVRLMRAAGAIPFVITNVPELCIWWETSNTIYGRTCNAYDSNRMSGGSSGGEAALLASAGSPFGIANDIGGSIRIPAFFNGIFGHKPSAMIVSVDGMWPECTGDAKLFALTIGPLCRFACDLKPMLKIMAGDRAKFLALDEPVNLSNLKYFYQIDNGGELFVSPVEYDIRCGMERVMQHIENEIGVLPECVKLDSLRNSAHLWVANVIDENEITSYECKLMNYDGQINPYMELLKKIFGWSIHTLPAILIAIGMRFTTQYGTAEQRALLKERDDLLREFEQMLGDDGVFIYPTHPTVAPYHNEGFIRAKNCGYTAVLSVLGFPCTTVPLGLGPTERLPIGLQVIANRNQDRLCFAVASELERAFGGWVMPAN